VNPESANRKWAFPPFRKTLAKVGGIPNEGGKPKQKPIFTVYWKTFATETMMSRLLYVLMICSCCLPVGQTLQGQDTSGIKPPTPATGLDKGTGAGVNNTVDRKKVWIVSGTQAAVWAGSFIALNQAWYADYPKSEFHFFNDWDEWQQMDKAGHVWSTYQISRLSADMWRWTGINRKKAAWLGGASGIAYLSIIEILDGFSDKWGFSTGDMLMNITGAGLFVSQDLLWQSQRIQMKMSYYPYDYPPDIRPRSDELFGTAGMERILKDYNSQTYWLSMNPSSFFPGSRIPKWLNISIGYNARLMLGGEENIWTNENGETVDRTDIERYRRFFLSLDADLTRIRTRSKLLKTVFSLINMVKIPAPALEWNTKGEFRLHGLYF